MARRSRELGTLGALAIIAVLAIGAKNADPKDDPCPTTPPHGYVLEVGYGDGNQAKALGEARSDAEARLIQKICAGLSHARCEGIKQWIRPWKDGRYTPGKRSACSAVAIEANKLDQLKAESVALDQHLARLAEEVARREAELLYVDAPVWSTGCAAGEVGAYLKVTVEGQLGHAESLKLDLGPERQAEAARLRMQLAPGPGGVVVVGLLRLPGDVGWTPLEGPKFSLDLFGVDPDECGACRPDEALGLEDSELVGEDELTVEIEIPGNSGRYCEGDVVEPIVRVNRPARVQLYNVTKDGTGYLLWPPPGGDGRVDHAVSLGASQLTASPDASDERLVAIAVPADGSFGPRDSWTGYCKVAGEFGPSLYPEGAAIGTATYTVLLSGGGGCPVSNVEGATAAAYEAPVCGP